MDIFYLDNSSLNELKANVDSNINKYKLEDNNWILEELGEDTFKKFYKEVPNFELDPKGREIDNSKVLYTNLSVLTPSEASEERLWAGLSHSIFWDFLRESFKEDIDKNSRTKFEKTGILNRYFFNIKTHARKRSMYINTLSKLWWVGYLCYNKENKENPFEYLDLFETAFYHKSINTFSSNIIANKDIRFSIFETAMDLKRKGIEIKGDTMVPLIKYLNDYGGFTLLDTFSKGELMELLSKYVMNNIEYIVNY